MNKKVIKIFDIQVSQANKTYSDSFELDKDISSVKGILITSDKDDLLYLRGSQKIELNKEEYFPEKYESKLLMSGINVSPNDRFYNLGSASPGNGILKVDYKDQDDGRSVFSAYRVSIYVECEKG